MTPSGVLINVNASLPKSKKKPVDMTRISGTIIQFIVPTNDPIMQIIINPEETKVVVLKRL